MTQPGPWENHTVKTLRKATKLKPEPFTREFVCSLVRNAYQQSPAAGFVGRACNASRKEGFREGEHIGKRDADGEWRQKLAPLVEFFLDEAEKSGDRFPRVSEDTAISEAIARLTAPLLVAAT